MHLGPTQRRNRREYQLDDRSDASGDLLHCDNTWGWLEAYAEAGGNFVILNIRPDFVALSTVLHGCQYFLYT